MAENSVAVSLTHRPHTRFISVRNWAWGYIWIVNLSPGASTWAPSIYQNVFHSFSLLHLHHMKATSSLWQSSTAPLLSDLKFGEMMCTPLHRICHSALSLPRLPHSICDQQLDVHAFHVTGELGKSPWTQKQKVWYYFSWCVRSLTQLLQIIHKLCQYYTSCVVLTYLT